MWNPRREQGAVIRGGLAIAFLFWLVGEAYSGIPLFVLAVTLLLVWMIETHRRS
jgi:Flp pilus assembly protein TadB